MGRRRWLSLVRTHCYRWSSSVVSSIVEKMAADIALTMNGGEWKDGKWYSEGHRKAWIKAVQPYANEIVMLREVLQKIADIEHEDLAAPKSANETVLWVCLDRCITLAENASKGNGDA